MEALIEARGLSREFVRGLRWWPGEQRRTLAVDDVSLVLARSTSVGLVGESGCGKSTLARLLIGLDRPTRGSLLCNGRDSSAFSRADWRHYWRSVQYVFQDAPSALNPHHPVGRILEAPLASLLALSPEARIRGVDDLLDQVGLARHFRDRYPHELSGGQAQRVVLARALAVAPAALILDEPVSALDISIQAQILALLRALRSELNLSYLLISHDLAVIEQMCEEVLVMHDGRVIERGPCEAVFATPQAAYTRRLLDAARAPRDARLRRA